MMVPQPSSSQPGASVEAAEVVEVAGVRRSPQPFRCGGGLSREVPMWCGLARVPWLLQGISSVTCCRSWVLPAPQCAPREVTISKQAYGRGAQDTPVRPQMVASVTSIAAVVAVPCARVSVE